MEDLQFKKADLLKDINYCIKFREDSFLSSFNSQQRMREEMGEGGKKYVDWLIQFAKINPQGVIHIWNGNKIVGQLEFKIEPELPDKAYINLFYLIPEARGKGISRVMHKYVIDTLIKKGCNGARLSVSETNKRAIAFYKKHGWTYLQPRKEDHTVHLYQLQF